MYQAYHLPVRLGSGARSKRNKGHDGQHGHAYPQPLNSGGLVLVEDGRGLGVRNVGSTERRLEIGVGTNGIPLASSASPPTRPQPVCRVLPDPLKKAVTAPDARQSPRSCLAALTESEPLTAHGQEADATFQR